MIARQISGASVGDRRHWVTRNRYQLALALLIVVLGPTILWTPKSAWSPPGIYAVESTAVGALVAMLLGAYLRRQMSVYPGTGTLTAVLPSFAVAYAAVMIVFFFLRLDYSRFQFGSAFILALVWFGALSLMESKQRRDRFLLLPFGQARRLLERPEADWAVAVSADALPADITGVVVDLRADMPAAWQKLLANAALSGIGVYHWKQVAESLTGRVDIEHMAENNLGSLLPSSAYLRIKRLFDAALVISTLPITVPLILIAAVCILICDGRPILFKQARVGFHGQNFVMLKFRTMREGAGTDAVFTAEGDPRVTRLGRLLRRLRIDELPQIVNIVRGEMSWVGPRPEQLEVVKRYEQEVPFYIYRHIVRPGITGWAQVHHGYTAEIEGARTKLRYDFYYVKYFSPWLDLLVLVKTIPTLVTGFGAR